MLARAWAAGAAPSRPVITIDPDATRVATYGAGKQGSAFDRTGQTGLSPLVGICGETGDVLAVRARGGSANDGRAMGRFIGACVAAIPAAVRRAKRLWIRVDSAGYQHDVVDAADRHDAYFTVTARQLPTVVTAIHELATSPHTHWRPAADAEAEVGSEIAETPFVFAGRRVRLIVRRQGTVVAIGTDRVLSSFAEVAKHYATEVRVCPAYQANRPTTSSPSAGGAPPTSPRRARRRRRWTRSCPRRGTRASDTSMGAAPPSGRWATPSRCGRRRRGRTPRWSGCR